MLWFIKLGTLLVVGVLVYAFVARQRRTSYEEYEARLVREALERNARRERWRRGE